MIVRRAADRLASGLMVLVLALGASLVAVQPPETIVWGRVVNARDGAPLPGAVVTMHGQASSAARRPQLTDAQGRFLFRLSSPTYRISVSKPGYFHNLAWDSAAGEVTGPGAFTTARTSSEPLTIALWPAAEISGTVFDEGNRPLAGVMVRADPTPRYPGTGLRPLVTTTDDRGQYRLTAVRPGSYVVNARLLPAVAVSTEVDVEHPPRLSPEPAPPLTRSPMIEHGQWFLQLPPTNEVTGPFIGGTASSPLVARLTYYPNALNAAAAQVLTLRPGQTMGGISMALPIERGYAIRGAVHLAGLPQAGFQVVALPGGSDDAMSRTAAGVASATSDRQGHFLLAGVPTGLYRVIAFPRPVGALAIRDIPWAEAVVDVNAGDVGSIDLNAVSLPSFEAVVSSMDESSVPLPMRLVGVRMEADPAGVRTGPVQMRFSPGVDGRLNLSPLPPGEYAMQLTPPPGWIVHSLSMNGTPTAGRTIRRSSQAAAILRIHLTAAHGSALVSVPRYAMDSTPSPAIVVLFPAQRTLWSDALHDIDRFKLMPVDSAGRAEFSGLLPGDYLVAAVRIDLPGLAWRDRRVLERLASQAAAIRVSAGAQASALVTAVPE